MNIETSSVVNIEKTRETSKSSTRATSTEKDFKAEIEDLKKNTIKEDKTKEASNEKNSNPENQKEEIKETNTKHNNNKTDTIETEDETKELNSTIEEITNVLNQTNDFSENGLNQGNKAPVNSNKEFNSQLLNNDINLQPIKQDNLSDIKTDISFAQNSNEAFSSFINNGSFQESSEDMQEDSQVISSMAENIAMVNKVLASKSQDSDKIGDVVDKTVNASSLNMTRNDVQFFVNLATNNEFDFNTLQEINKTQKSVAVSETLTNMMLESMKNNKAFRINFDNDISVIIKLSKEGKISANFIPGSDVAENYLRNNLSNLVQRFEEEGLPYDELTHQRQKRENEQEQNKKDKNNE